MRPAGVSLPHVQTIQVRNLQVQAAAIDAGVEGRLSLLCDAPEIGREFRWHDLRHTWASWHVQRGTRLQELMELVGWSSYEVVLRYAHLATDHLRDAASRIDGTFTTRVSNLRLIHSR